MNKRFKTSNKSFTTAVLLMFICPSNSPETKKNGQRSVGYDTANTMNVLKHISRASAKQPALSKRRAWLSIFIKCVEPGMNILSTQYIHPRLNQYGKGLAAGVPQKSWCLMRFFQSRHPVNMHVLHSILWRNVAKYWKCYGSISSQPCIVLCSCGNGVFGTRVKDIWRPLLPFYRPNGVCRITH